MLDTTRDRTTRPLLLQWPSERSVAWQLSVEPDWLVGTLVDRYIGDCMNGWLLNLLSLRKHGWQKDGLINMKLLD